MKHFYHLYCGRPWQSIASSHMAALRGAGAKWDVTIGIVGPPAERARVRSWFEACIADVSFTEADVGYEQVTLHALHAWSKQAPNDKPVLYAHSKGITHTPGDGRDPLIATAWRDSMTRYVVGGWERCVQLLADHDAVGCHWLSPEVYPDEVDVPYFGGNFWWARAGFLAQLPPPRERTMYDAEGWIGRGSPRVFDLKPGWPTFALFAQDTVRLLNPDAR